MVEVRYTDNTGLEWLKCATLITLALDICIPLRTHCKPNNCKVPRPDKILSNLGEAVKTAANTLLLMRRPVEQMRLLVTLPGNK